MSREELLKLADRYQAKADTAFQAYQETGIGRYGSTARRNEDIADALRIAAGAADEHQAYVGLRVEMSNFASRASVIACSKDEKERAKLVDTLVRDIIFCGHHRGLLGRD